MKFALELTMIDLFLLWLEFIFHAVSCFVYQTYFYFVLIFLTSPYSIENKIEISWILNEQIEFFLVMSLHSFTQLWRSQLYLKNQTGMNFLSGTSFFSWLHCSTKITKKWLKLNLYKIKTGRKITKVNYCEILRMNANFAIRERVTAIVTNSWRFSISKVTQEKHTCFSLSSQIVESLLIIIENSFLWVICF